MTEKEFLINNINEWRSQFKGIMVNYEYDDSIDFHILEVGPEEIRRGNKEYMYAEMQLLLSFVELYPDANLVITNPLNQNQK